MNDSSAQQWVTVSAFVVLAVYAYRRLIEPAAAGKAKNIVGVGTPVPLGQFVTAWGFTFFVIAIMAEADPGLGGGFALLVATSDLLTNASSLFADVATQTATTPATPATTSKAKTPAKAKTASKAGL